MTLTGKLVATNPVLLKELILSKEKREMKFPWLRKKERAVDGGEEG